MSHRRFGLPLILTTAILALCLTASASEPSGLVDGPVVRAKAASPLSPAARAYLGAGEAETARVWVLFTDKGVQSRTSFESQAAAVDLSDKVLRRRAKVGRDRVLFADLPVVEHYLDAVMAEGAVLRRASRWLNAASFEAPLDALDRIADLPFVAEIRPVARYARELPEVSEIRDTQMPPQALAADALNYGYATDQINQINVPAVHEKGIDGSGVTLAIFDTGFRKTHEAFAAAIAEGRLLAEWDFIFNDGNTDYEPGVDWSSSTSHGTYIWSVSAGYKPGRVIGPGYKANILLAKTEDVRSETQVEEDNWVAALEWADGHGADVITSSLGYSDWYTYADMDGQTAVTTIAANTAAGLGIIVCNSMGNEGPAAGTLSAPADAHDIVAVGAVDASNLIAGFSSRGPTYDGRMKPEVVARGVSTWAATNASDVSYGTANGTSLSTPLVAGVAVLLVQAHPDYSPQLIRQTLLETADRAASPDNNYGSGLVDADAALERGVALTANVTVGHAPLSVDFTGTSTLSPTSWLWQFGDGASAAVQNPTHTYDEPGAYTVSLTIETAEYGPISSIRPDLIVAVADTAWYGTDSAFAGDPLVVSVYAANTQPLERLVIPFTYGSADWMTLDSVRLGSRTAYFQRLSETVSDPGNNRFVYTLTANTGGTAPPLAPGTGEVLRVYFTTDEYAFGGQSTRFDSTNLSNPVAFLAPVATYTPLVFSGSAALINAQRGDANFTGSVNISDLTYLVNFFFRSGPEPVSLQAGDANRDFTLAVSDLTFLSNYLFRNGPAPVNP